MMSHRTAKQAWGTVDLDLATGRVFVREDWRYLWRLWPGVVQAWTYREKRQAHTRIDRAIWRIWSNRLFINAAGVPRFGAHVPVNFDVRWVLHGGDWTVTVWKMPPTATPTAPHRSFVLEATHQIELNTADLRPRGAGNAAGASTHRFTTPPHEFAHTIHNPDEYNAPSPYIADTQSLVNIGGQVRARHLHLVVDALNGMHTGAVFSA